MKNIEELIRLKAENPELEIVPMVQSEVCAGDDFSCWMGSWGKAEIDEVYHEDERIYFRSYDEDEIEERIFNRLESGNPSSSDSFLDEKVEEELAKIEWVKVIVVKIGMP